MCKGKTFKMYAQVETELENLLKKRGVNKDAYKNILSKFKTLMSKIMYYFDIDGVEYEINKESLSIFFKDKIDSEENHRSLKLVILPAGQTKYIKVIEEGNECIGCFDNYRPPVSILSFINRLGYVGEREILFRNKGDRNEKNESRTHSAVRPSIRRDLLDEVNAACSFIKKIEKELFEILKVSVNKTHLKNKGKNGILYIGFEGETFKNGSFNKLDLNLVNSAFKEVLKKNKNDFFSSIKPMEEVSIPYTSY